MIGISGGGSTTMEVVIMMVIPVTMVILQRAMITPLPATDIVLKSRTRPKNPALMPVGSYLTLRPRLGKRRLEYECFQAFGGDKAILYVVTVGAELSVAPRCGWFL